MSNISGPIDLLAMFGKHAVQRAIAISQAKLRALPSIGKLVDDPGQPGQLEALKDKDDEAQKGLGKLALWVELFFMWPSQLCC